MKHTCPCCGYKILDEPVGSFEICPICFWEADTVQSTEPDHEGGPNKVSLRQAQANYAKYGYAKPHIKNHVRKPTVDDVKDPEWRPLN